MIEKILLIKDDPDIRKIVEAALTLSEYNVTPASNGLEGLSTASRQRFDLIITDKMMPVMDGNQFIKELSKIADPPPVIMLTADSTAETEPNSLVKVTCFKPISIFKLLDVVKNALK